MKMLIWKEWRENRNIIAWFSILLALIMVACPPLKILDAGSSVSVLWGSWLLAGVFAASGLIAREVGSGTLQFLMSLPVSRRQTWRIKAIVGTVVLGLTIVSTTAVWALLQWLFYGASGLSDGLGRLIDYVGWDILAAFGCFAVSLTVSTLLDRTVSAAMVATAACIGILVPLAYLAETYHLAGSGVINLIIPIAILIPAFIVASYIAFTRGESLRTPRRFILAAVGVLAALAVTLPPALAGYAWLTAFQRHSAVLAESLSADGRWIAMSTASRGVNALLPSQGPIYDGYLDSGYLSQHLVVQPLAGKSSPHILPAGQVLAWSPDGRFLLYNRSGGPLGIGLATPRLTLVDVNTGRMRNVDLGEPFYRPVMQASWSPDGQWLSIMVGYDGIGWKNDLYFFSNRALRQYSGDIHAQNARTIDLPTNMVQITARIWRVGDPEISRVGLPSKMAWDNSSRYLYVVYGSQLIAVSPQKSSAHATSSGSNISPAAFLLCSLNSNFTLEMQLTRDPHRALVTLTGATSTSQLIDLAAATADAVRRGTHVTISSVEQIPGETPPPFPVQTAGEVAIPSLSEWVARWSTAPDLHRYAGSWRTSISPDGKHVLAQRTIPIEGKGKRGWRISGPVEHLDLDQLATSPRQLSVPLPPDAWLPDGHSFYLHDKLNNLSVFDLSTGQQRTIARGLTDQPLGVDSGRRLLLQSRDIATPSWRPVWMGGKNGPPPAVDVFRPISGTLQL